MTARKLFVVWISCLFLASVGAEEYDAHEWGTFTTLSDPTGKLLTGLEVEEESLPTFVHNLIFPKKPGESGVSYAPPHFEPSNSSTGFGLRSKAAWMEVKNVTVKMETPVIYFYSENDKPFPLQVNVGFQGGSITQWYPQRSAGEQAPFEARVPEHAVDFADGTRQGAIEWKINVLPRTDSPNFEVVKASDTPTWIHPRLPDSNIVASQEEPDQKEKYLFYRGIGNFELPAKFRQTSDDSVVIESESPISAALVFQKNGSGIRFQWIKDLAPAQTHQTTFGEKDTYRPIPEAQRELLISFQAVLVDAGLNQKEAESMLLTWWKSYFIGHGTRVFWIVPKPFVDEILPLQLDPAPQNLERVIVGRAELMSPEFEKRVMTEFSKPDPNENSLRLHRYFRAYQAHYETLTD